MNTETDLPGIPARPWKAHTPATGPTTAQPQPRCVLPGLSRLDAALIAAAFAWLLWFAHGGLGAPFTGDDLMNLHGHLSQSPVSLVAANLRYWSTAYRPLGGLFYTAIYSAFGFHPLPFRVACFALLALNLGLLWRFAFRLSGRRETAFLAVLLAAYHAWFVDLYYSTGTVYDLLAYSFFIGACNFYLGIRARGATLTLRQITALTALYLCALNAKEMAVTLPAILVLYELTYHAADLRACGPRQLWRRNMPLVTLAALAVPYIVGKLTGPGSLTENPAYRLSITPARYLHSLHLYLNPLFYRDHFFRDSNTVQFLLALLAIALAWRNPALRFAWGFLLVTMLPAAFIGHSSGFFLYLPMAGWALYAAELLAGIRRFLAGALCRMPLSARAARRAQTATAVALPVALALFLAPLHVRESAKTLRLFQSAQPPSRQLAAELLALRPTLPPHAHVLFLASPLSAEGHVPLFMTRLLYGDLSITVDDEPERFCPPAGQAPYDAVFRFQRGHLVAAALPLRCAGP